MNTFSRSRWLALLALLLLALSACGESQEEPTAEGTEDEAAADGVDSDAGEPTATEEGGATEADADPAVAWEPTEAVTMTIPTDAGGGTDAVMRGIATVMEEHLEVPLRVVNDGRGSGRAAGEALRQSEADNHTFSAGLFPGWGFGTATGDLPFHAVEHFRWVTRIRANPWIALAQPEGAFPSIAELAEADEPVRFGSVGWGTGSPEATILFADALGIEYSFVEYDSTAEALAGLTRGDAEVFLTSVGPALEWIEDGSVAGIALLSETPDPRLPDVPSLVEAGHVDASDPVITVTTFQILVNMHADTPDEVVDFYADLFRRTMEDERFLAWAEENDLSAEVSDVWMTPEEATDLVEESVTVGEQYKDVLGQ